ncbi:MAG: hypothetical protein LBU82_02905, partial [Treponema sp.]|nr:hypothetical protein [Treponema sp.]
TVAAVCVAGYVFAGILAPFGFGLTTAVVVPASLLILIILLLVLPKAWKVKERKMKNASD